MEPAFILIVAGLTSVGTVILGVRGLRLSKSGLWMALGRVCECVGLTLMFFLLNLAVGMLAILTWRSLIGSFMSIYILSDATLLILSSLQALTLQAWRECSSRQRMSESEYAGLGRRDL